MREQEAALREQLAFEKQQREWREARIVSIARKEPDLSCSALGERFGMTDSGMHDLLQRHGVSRPITDRIDYRRSNLRHSYFKTRRTA